MKAERIETIDVRRKTSVADYFIVCSGTSDTHVNAIAEKVSDRMRDLGVKPVRSSKGPGAGGWALFDYGDVIFHVMLEEKRQFYDLENLWKSIQPDPGLLD